MGEIGQPQGAPQKDSAFWVTGMAVAFPYGGSPR